jgi:hypothetical protein
VRWLDPLSGALPPSWGQRIFELDNHTLHVLNFNPKEIETLSSDMFSEASHTPTVQKPGSDIFPHEGAFKGKLIGSLPCIRQKVRTEVEADSAWFDGVRLMYKRVSHLIRTSSTFSANWSIFQASKDPKGQNCKLTINSLYFG